MTPVTRRIVYATSYEALGMTLSTAGLFVMTEGGLALSFIAGAATTLIALGWSFAFNTLFENWEARQPVRGRSLRKRITHAVLYECGLTALMVPCLAWWFGVSLWQALIYDLWLLAFFAVYTLAFTWAFDRIFGLPASAR